jgi:hypothetical protein
LLDRSRLPLPRALQQVAGLQTQYAPSAYIGLWTRLDGFQLADLTRALERRRAIQASLMRGTIHVVSHRDYWLFAEGIRRSRQEWWRRVHKRVADDLDLEAVARRILAALAEGPLRRDELEELIAEPDPRRRAAVWSGLPVNLVRVPPSGTWERRRADLFAAADDWLERPEIDEDAGLDHLLRRYLCGFGPARLAEAADWASVPATRLKPSVERLGLRRFRDEDGRELLDVPRAPLPGGDVRAPARFLPHWDANLLVHARRAEILPERFRARIFHVKAPHSFATFLVDGAVAGIWRVERTESRATLVLEPFEPLSGRALRDVRAEGERLVRFVEPDAAAYAVRRV